MTTRQVKIVDSAHTLDFLKFLGGDQGDSFTFQTFSDGSPKTRAHSQQFHGAFKEFEPKLRSLNQQGAGIFVCVNETDLKGRKKDNIKSIRAFFIDADDVDINDYALEPSCIVQSKRGVHAYWLISDEDRDKLSEFAKIQKVLSRYYGTDTSVNDVNRVMRLPGFYHLKNPVDPFFVKTEKINGKEYSLDQILASHKVGPAQLKENEYLNWISSLPSQEGSDNQFGGRNNTAYFLTCEGLAKGIRHQTIRNGLEKYCSKSGLDLDEVDSMLERASKEHSIKSFVSTTKSEKNGQQGFELAKKYLEERGATIKFWRQSFYSYENLHYAPITESDLKADIMRWSQEKQKGKSLRTSMVKEIIANIQGLGHVPHVVEPQCEIDRPTKRFICLNNGVLSQGKYDVKPKLEPLTKNIFNLGILPYSYNGTAKCPIWIKILEKVLPEDEARSFLQEWFGYNLVMHNTFGKFVIFVGEGANGKSVALTVLRELLGEKNVSSVMLETFTPQKSHFLAATMGRLANIVEEIGDIERVAEGLLKSYTTNGVLTVDRKYKDPIDFRPTARLTFATNNLPHFRDKSDAIWRRLVVVPFNIQILEKEQNQNYIDSNFWISSGELSGVFNWAYEGLVRLMKRGRFIEPETSMSYKRGFRDKCNSARLFLNEYCEPSAGTKVSTSELYRGYSEYCRESGFHSMSASHFNTEVERMFQKVERTKNPVRLGGEKRQRVWIGIKYTEYSRLGGHDAIC